MTKRILLSLLVLAAFGGRAFAADEAPKADAKPKKAAAAPKAAKPAAAPEMPVNRDLLLQPAKATETAPEVFKARFVTTQGPFVVEVHRAWSPLGADRFYNLVKLGYYDGCSFFRVLKGFMAQVGIHDDPEVSGAWRGARIQDDPNAGAHNTRGMVSYAMGGPNTRTTQIFFNYGDNSGLDGMGFTPFGRVVEGMENIDKLYGDYGEGAPQGGGPDQGRIQFEGGAYLRKSFPKLDSIKTARLVPEEKPAEKKDEKKASK